MIGLAEIKMCLYFTSYSIFDSEFNFRIISDENRFTLA